MYERKQLNCLIHSFFNLQCRNSGQKVPQCQLFKITVVLIILQKANINFVPINTAEVLGKKITRISYFTKNNFIEYIKSVNVEYIYMQKYTELTSRQFFSTS